MNRMLTAIFTFVPGDSGPTNPGCCQAESDFLPRSGHAEGNGRLSPSQSNESWSHLTLPNTRAPFRAMGSVVTRSEGNLVSYPRFPGVLLAMKENFRSHATKSLAILRGSQI